jgi:acetyl-CoA C-acetyltransferase
MKVGVLGVATSKFGELWDISPRQLVREVVDEALSQSDLKLGEIDALYVGNMLSGILGGQENLGALFASELGLRCPAFKIEGACASGGLAFYNAAIAIKSGTFSKVLVVGVEKMTDHKPEAVASGLMGAGSDEERQAGATFPGLYALMARAHMQKYGTTEEQLAAVAVKNHFHASLNGKAHFTFPVTLEQVMQSTKIADPLKLLDCSPISDGAAAAVVVAGEIVKQKTKQPVWIKGAAVATDSLGLAGRNTLVSLPAALKAAQVAYKQAGMEPKVIDVAEVHDCFTIAEVMAMEDLGFYAPGQAAEEIASGKTTLGKGNFVVNTSGGLKASGHPVGATGIKQVVEVVNQLRGQSGKKQVDNARVGLTHNVGGSGAVAAVHIFSTD